MTYLKSIKSLLIFAAILVASYSCRKEETPVSARTEILNEIVSQIEHHRYGEVHSLIIEQNDSVIFEKYFNGYSRETKHALYSVTKSFTSALVGICLARGYIDSIDMPVMQFFPEYKDNIANYDTLKERITIRNLLTMTSGFTWDEWTTSYNDPDNDLIKMTRSSDWIKYVLDLPMSYAPGTHITYSSGVSHVLSGIISKASGQPARDFARDNLFTYLDINDWYWENRTPEVSIGGWGLNLRPVDMVKFGQLYLKKGRWNNVQVIPQSWVEESTQPYYQINYWCDYGYQWWRYGEHMAAVNAAGIFCASGRGEQYIWVIPEYNAVVVCTAWNDGKSLLEHVLWDYILRALEI